MYMKRRIFLRSEHFLRCAREPVFCFHFVLLTKLYLEGGRLNKEFVGLSLWDVGGSCLHMRLEILRL